MTAAGGRGRGTPAGRRGGGTPVRAADGRWKHALQSRLRPSRKTLGALGLCVAAGAAGGVGALAQGGADLSVLQYHKSLARDGHYVDPAFTRAAAARLHRDPAFHASVTGPVYAQPLFWSVAGGKGGDLLFVVTEQNRVSALDASTGAEVWHQALGTPVRRAQLPCGNIDPLGITGTPVIDAASRTLFVGAMVLSPDGGNAPRHIIAGLSIDDGALRPGWPINVSTIRAGPVAFSPSVQNQRAALALLGGVLYIPYGGHYGDCGDYHGWVVGVPVGHPDAARAWATRARGGGIWAPGGIASDGAGLFVATGNTFYASTWGDGEAVIRLEPGPSFSQRPADFYAPANWSALDSADADLGGSGPILVHVPGAKPSELVVALGKDGYAHLINRARMGGVGATVATHHVSAGPIIGAGAAYTTGGGTYVVFRGAGTGCPRGEAGDLIAIKIVAEAPPAITVAWCAQQHGAGSPIVTTTDGRSDAIVWTIGAGGDNRLRGFDGETGRVIFAGGDSRAQMSRVQRYQTPIVAKGRMFVAGDSEVYAFTAR
jgi:putative pyrroloquinoline-quinone binding quinoprotein